MLCHVLLVCFPTHKVSTSKVCLHHCIPPLECHVSSSAGKLPSSIVHQEVNLPKLFQRGRHQVFDILFTPDIAPPAHNGPQLAHLLGCSCNLLLIPASNHYFSTKCQ